MDDERVGLFPARKPLVPVAPVPVVVPADPVILPPPPVAAPPGVEACPVYKGKANAFWTKKEWNEAHDCNVYWDPASKAWYRYHKDDDCYKQVPPDVNK